MTIDDIDMGWTAGIMDGEAKATTYTNGEKEQV